MVLMSSTPMLKKAKKEKYGVLAVNVDNLEMIQAVIDAAEKKNSPIILQTTESAIKYMGLDYIVELVKVAAKNTNIPIALHLDHGQDYKLAMRCLRTGYTSVMIDASDYSFEENVKQTIEVVKVAQAMDLNVEAEIGKVGGVEDDIKVDDDKASLADPKMCEKFVKTTNVHTLAPAIGTAHGIYKTEPNIDFDRISKISSLVDTPLVLHGGSGIPDWKVKKCIDLGMSKINLGTQVKNVFFESVRDYSIGNPTANDIRKPLLEAKNNLSKLIVEKIELIGSENKA